MASRLPSTLKNDHDRKMPHTLKYSFGHHISVLLPARRPYKHSIFDMHQGGCFAPLDFGDIKLLFCKVPRF